MRVVRNLLVVVALMCLTSALAFATPITGNFSLTGGIVEVTLATIDFSTVSLPTWGTPGGFIVSLPTGDLPAIIPGGTAGLITDLNQVTQPAGQAFAPLPGFISFPTVPLFTLELTSIYAGSNPLGTCLGAGSTCTPSLGEPPYSPFNLDNIGGGSTVSFGAQGYAYNNGDGDVTIDAVWTGTFTAQFPAKTYQAVMADLLSTGWVQTTYSASISLAELPVPEPATFGLIGFGLLALGAARFGKKRNCKS